MFKYNALRCLKTKNILETFTDVLKGNEQIAWIRLVWSDSKENFLSQQSALFYSTGVNLNIIKDYLLCMSQTNWNEW